MYNIYEYELYMNNKMYYILTLNYMMDIENK